EERGGGEEEPKVDGERGAGRGRERLRPEATGRQDESEEPAVLGMEVRDVLTPRPDQGEERDGPVDPAEERASARHARSYHGSGRRVNRAPAASPSRAASGAQPG